MRNLVIIPLLCFVSIQMYGQPGTTIKRPKLVVGIVVDQMRWDYLYRYYYRYAADGGFKRLIQQGFLCENTSIPYVPTLTACGHASIFSGSVPAIHGITGNDWWDYNKNAYSYCTGDASKETIGSNSEAGKMSPSQLMVSTIGDELKLATNFRSKVIGIALKDRGAILCAGHSADAAYWYDNSNGNWISSSFYMSQLPKWASDLNAKKLADQYYAKDWTTSYPIETYVQSVIANASFPKSTKQYAGQRYDVIVATPYGNNLTLDMAKAAIEGEQLGTDSITDLLSISFSSPDYIGHAFGPNSVEEEDCFLKLDIVLGDLLRYLDEKIGNNEYFVFLTADHGAAHTPAILKDHRIPAGNFDSEQLEKKLNESLSAKFRSNNIVTAIINYQVYINREEIQSKKINKTVVLQNIVDMLKQDSAVKDVIAIEDLNTSTTNSQIKQKISNGYFSSRSGDLQILLQPQWIDGFVKGGTTHGVWNPYDSHIPLIWYGWNIPKGKTYAPTFITDIAPTLSAMLNIQAPNGSIGNVIEAVIKN